MIIFFWIEVRFFLGSFKNFGMEVGGLVFIRLGNIREIWKVFLFFFID